jgi:hypothetical protein
MGEPALGAPTAPAYRRSVTTPTPPDLTGVHLKLERADQHITALGDEITEFGRDYITYELRQGKTRRLVRGAFPLHKADPAAMVVMIGDICHNLRSALDHLVVLCYVVSSNGRLQTWHAPAMTTSSCCSSRITA